MTQTVSTLVSNTLASPVVQNASGSTKGILHVLSDTVTVPDTAAADTIILAPIPVNCVPIEIELTTADLGTTGTVDIGLFRKTVVADAVVFVAVDKDCIANNLDVTLASSAASASQRMAGLASDTAGARAWEIAGLSARPAYGSLYIGLTTDTGTTLAGSASVKVIFTE